LGLKEVSVTTSQFADVEPNAWYAGSIQAAYEAGLIAGISATEFAPEENITREQMAALIMRAYSKLTGTELDKITPANISKFTDLDEISDWARHSVLVANQLRIVGGMTETTLEPQGNATRAQGIVMIKRLLEVTASL
ncbi:MAG: S-layer homology domain-containing protein, partial [Peptococcales bacterium]